ncbi:MAG: alanine racemase [Candidatus Aminicenantes bacterium]|nr:alanine racemase [Candidatus Aminicenantes bacterium]
MESKHTQWLEINAKALEHNIRQFQSLLGEERRLLAMVKANAYGHGMREVSQIALKSGVDWLGVNSIDEALILRNQGIQCPILCVGYIPLHRLKDAVQNKIRMTVYNEDSIKELAQICRSQNIKAHLHIKVETGTYRQGIHEQEVIPFINHIRKHKGLVIEGVSSHFANIEDTTDHSYAENQLNRFQNFIRIIEKQGVQVPFKHMACSAAVILFPQTYFNMARIGIGMYGLWPSNEVYVSSLLRESPQFVLKPVLSWKTRVAQVKRVPKHEFIGYGCTYKTTRDTCLAVIPVGYYDGYSRGLSNASYVLIKGKRAPVRGRVAMNFIMADITDIPSVQVEDPVTLIGKEKGDSFTVDQMASLIGTINYEVTARIRPGISRIVV